MPPRPGLFGTPSLTPETETALVELGLGSERISSLEKLAALQEEINQAPALGLIAAFCELGYDEAVRLEKEDPAYSGEIYVSIILNSWRYLFDPALESGRNTLGAEYQKTVSYYNKASERLLRLIFRNREQNGAETPVPGEVWDQAMNDRNWRLECVMNESPWRSDEVGAIRFASDYKVDGLTVQYTREGIGVPVIVSRKRCGRPEEKLYTSSLSYPMTLLIRPNPRGGSLTRGEPPREPRAWLELYDPLVSRSARVGETEVPLAADLTTPLSYNFIDPAVNEIGALGLTKPEAFYQPFGEENRDLAGFYMIAPYDPNKIPVILVHGFCSTPMTWLAMIGAFQNEPEIWDRYQFWFWCYPTGLPWWVSAAGLRADLDRMYEGLDPDGVNPNFKDSVIVGYSMGGLVASLQVCESENKIWNLVSDQPFDEAQLKGKEDLRSVFFFHPNPNLTRLVTIAAPFKGSDSVNSFVQWFADRVIARPENFNRVAELLNSAQKRKKDSILNVKNSVESMSPGSPFFEALDQLERPETVAFNNIIGMTESGFLFKKVEGDRIVRFESAHRDDAESEIAVDSYHTYVHTDPAAIREMIRILREHQARHDGTESSSVPKMSRRPSASVR